MNEKYLSSHGGSCMKWKCQDVFMHAQAESKQTGAGTLYAVDDFISKDWLPIYILYIYIKPPVSFPTSIEI